MGALDRRRIDQNVLNNKKLRNPMFRPIDKHEIKSHIKNIEKEGYSVIKSLILPIKQEKVAKSIEELYLTNRQEFDELSRNQLPAGKQRESLEKDEVINHLPIYDNLFAKMSVEGDHHEIIRLFLNDKYYGIESNSMPNYNLAQFSARKGHSRLEWHNDIRFQHTCREIFSLQVFISLEKMNIDNGTLCVVPGSHLTGIYPSYPEEFNDYNAIDLESGDAIIFDSRIHHSTKVEKQNGNHPWTILGTYRSWWLKQTFDYFGYLNEKNKSSSNGEVFSKSELAIFGGNAYVDQNPNQSLSVRRRTIDIC